MALRCCFPIKPSLPLPPPQPSQHHTITPFLPSIISLYIPFSIYPNWRFDEFVASKCAHFYIEVFAWRSEEARSDGVEWGWVYWAIPLGNGWKISSRAHFLSEHEWHLQFEFSMQNMCSVWQMQKWKSILNSYCNNFKRGLRYGALSLRSNHRHLKVNARNVARRVSLPVRVLLSFSVCVCVALNFVPPQNWTKLF